MNKSGIKILIILGQMMLSFIFILIHSKRRQRPGDKLYLPWPFLIWVAVSSCLLLLVAGGL